MIMYRGSFSFGFTADLVTGRRTGFRYSAFASDESLYRGLCESLEGIGREAYF